MTAPTTLPADVQAIVAALAWGPSTLENHDQAAITAAFDAGLIAVDGSNVSENVPEWPGLHWVTRYALRRAVTR